MDDQIASGFNRCHITTSEGGAIEDEYAVLYARDRTETTSEVWLGMTAGCAVCHDHKYDRFLQKEFYSLSAFFNNTTQKPMDGNIKDTPPTIFVPATTDCPRWKTLSKEKKTADQNIENRRKTGRDDFKLWLPAASPASFSKQVPTDTPALLAFGRDATNQILIEGKVSSIAVATNAAWQDGIAGPKA